MSESEQEPSRRQRPAWATEELVSTRAERRSRADPTHVTASS
ncbi:hypothetical protein [Streptomyces sp. MBT65]|nr:hypothetical protein [Streptomyces sp. MBT65]